VIILAYTCTT